MKSLPLELPLLQNWSCHSCGGCCRQHAIYITDEERARIANLDWQPSDGLPPGQPLFIDEGGWLTRKSQRLAHQPDGACVFLDAAGRCKIHARFGEATKPLACRIYPYAFHPAGKSIAVSLRFSCPSVARNQGADMDTQASEIQSLAQAVVPANFEALPPPALTPQQTLSWEESTWFVQALEHALTQSGVPLLLKLLRALHMLNFVERATFEKVRGERIPELLELLLEATAEELPALPPNPTPPSQLGQTHFRLLAGQYARKETQSSLQAGWSRRWQNFRAGLILTRNRGVLPNPQPGFAPVEVSTLSVPIGIPDAASAELLTRYLIVKVQSWSFFGPAYYHIPLVEGFRSFVMTIPAILWIARWAALSAGRERVTHDDIVLAVNVVDHQHGYSPVFGTWGFRSRVRSLQKLGDIERLILWYAGAPRS